jgi:hypothetical protein
MLHVFLYAKNENFYPFIIHDQLSLVYINPIWALGLYMKCNNQVTINNKVDILVV